MVEGEDVILSFISARSWIQMKNCKVIATCFVGKRVQEHTKAAGNPPLMIYHAQNFPTAESALELMELNIEQERTVDPGIPCDTIIVNNDVGWEPGNNYLNSINMTPTHSGVIRILHRENWGRSFGAYNEAYQKFRNDYEYWIFTEDDILINGDNYFKIARDTYNRNATTGFVAFQGVTNDGLDGETGDHVKHAHSGAGLTHIRILNELNEKFGKLPHQDRTQSQTYDDNIRYGEIAFTNEIFKLGYELVTVESEHPLYWFAYDYMKGIRIDAKPTLLPLVTWHIDRLYKKLYHRTIGKARNRVRPR